MSPFEQPTRFGTIALRKGFITLAQLTRAMEFQLTEEVVHHQHRLIGDILLEEGALNMAGYKEILEEIRHRE